MSYYQSEAWRMENEGEGLDTRTENQCERCGEGTREDLEKCSAPGCEHHSHPELCEGCTFQCGACGLLFCQQHIIATPVPDQPRMATFTCAVCEREAQQVAA